MIPWFFKLTYKLAGLDVLQLGSLGRKYDYKYKIVIFACCLITPYRAKLPMTRHFQKMLGEFIKVESGHLNKRIW